jgi:hypothetical protein
LPKDATILKCIYLYSPHFRLFNLGVKNEAKISFIIIGNTGIDVGQLRLPGFGRCDTCRDTGASTNAGAKLCRH